jgi:hypothetical protein
MPEALIETAIGLFFVFILMSLVSSQLVEWIASYRRWRAKHLEKAIRNMLQDPVVQKNLDQDALLLADKIYEHPLIASLHLPDTKPSYIPAGKFALALFDVIVTAGTKVSTVGRARVGLEQVKNHLLASLPSQAEVELLSLIDQIQKLIDKAKATGPNPEAIAALSLPPLLNDELNGFYKRYSISPATINALVQPFMVDSDLQYAQILNGVVQMAKYRPQLAQLITSLFSGLDVSLSTGESRLVAARRNIEEWFDDTMDRAGGWYKQHTQIWLGIVGFILALALNVDTTSIAFALWRDPTLRQNVLEQAQKYQMTSTKDGKPITNPEEAAQAIRDLNSELSQQLLLPVGWHTEVHGLQPGEACVWFPQRPGDIWGFTSPQGCVQVRDAPASQNAGLLAKVLGLVLTALAVSQGAPFWFDVLSKLGNMRSAGPVPATSAEKAKEKSGQTDRKETVSTRA